VEKLEERLAHIDQPISLSIIGCVVNGPGEALMTDIGLTGGGAGTHMVYGMGKTSHTVKTEEMVEHIVGLVEAKAAEMKAAKAAVAAMAEAPKQAAE
jgi:(E)-4-hydroxy-3-methylbut-2-enyl-diphosphate synthase